MSSCTILGNGTGLDPALIPSGSVPIGVNRSYEAFRAPIACTMDSSMGKRMHSQAQAFLYLVKRFVLEPMHNVAYVDSPKWIDHSGPFAIWCAVQLGFREIYLLGFGGQGHFYGDDEKDRAYMAKSLLRVVQYAREQGVEVAPLQPVHYCPEIELEVSRIGFGK